MVFSRQCPLRKRPSHSQIRDLVSSTVRSPCQGTIPTPHLLKSPTVAPSPPNSYPSSPARGSSEVLLATEAAAGSSQHPQALTRWPATTTRARTHRRTRQHFPRAPILNSPGPPPSPRAPRLARLGGCAAPSPASCAAGKRRQVLPRPEGARRTSAPAGSVAPPAAAAADARAPSCTLTRPSRSGHLGARPRDTRGHTTPRFGSGGGPVGRLRQR